MPPPSMQPSSSLGDKDLTLTAIFEELQKHVSSIPDIVRKVKAIFLWNITKAGQLAAQWSECVQYAHYTFIYVCVYNSIQQDVPKIYSCKQCVQKCLCIHPNTSFYGEGGRGKHLQEHAQFINNMHYVHGRMLLICPCVCSEINHTHFLFYCYSCRSQEYSWGSVQWRAEVMYKCKAR